MTDWINVVVGAVVLSLLISIPSTLTLPWAKERYMRKIRLREQELKKSWDKFRVQGKVLTYPEDMWKSVMGLFILPLYVIFAFGMALIAAAHYHPEDVGGLISVMLIFAALTAIWPWLWFIRVYSVAHEVTCAGIRKTSLFSKSFSASWDEVNSITYSYWRDSYVLHTNKGIIRIRGISDGIKFFLQMVSENVPPERRTSLEGGERWSI